MEVTHTAIPESEIEIFKNLPNIKVVFDVGARVDTDYLDLKPDIELHAFEPNPLFFGQLVQKIGNRRAHVSNFGLGDVAGEMVYEPTRQAFSGGEVANVTTGDMYSIKTLDSYVKEHDIKEIDFLKIDTEGYDFKVLLGGLNTIPKCRYIQYEHWDDLRRFHILLGQSFKMEYIGYRNVLCTRLW